MPRLAVIAIGGNSLIRDEQHKSVHDQYEAVVETTRHIAGIVQQGYNVVITHGNGPQVGFILLRSEIAEKVAGLHPVPLDSCGADTQGAIGYQIQQALHNEFLKRGIERQAATVVTQVLVDQHDPAFQNPSKPVGSFYTKEEIDQKVAQEGWTVAEDAGRGWRRVVPSPMPVAIVELDAIKRLVEADFVVIAAGGGGIPVVRNSEGLLEGVAAVIDKDYATSLLATNLEADLFIISTAVEKVYINFRKPDEQAIDRMTVSEARAYAEQGQFAKGSMLPKITAAIAFLERGGQEALITNPESLERALAGHTGTRIVRG
ncbi:MAG TPA: carbamate kinase [Candidatus Cryosericum sp.]|jgi:carbamate kinase|nr:carbamate kinase [Candidatus Cryosericum sp.]